MNYWPALPCNLSECQEPLFEYISSLSINGSKTAKVSYCFPPLTVTFEAFQNFYIRPFIFLFSYQYVGFMDFQWLRFFLSEPMFRNARMLQVVASS